MKERNYWEFMPPKRKLDLFIIFLFTILIGSIFQIVDASSLTVDPRYKEFRESCFDKCEYYGLESVGMDPYTKICACISRNTTMLFLPEDL